MDSAIRTLYFLGWLSLRKFSFICCFTDTLFDIQTGFVFFTCLLFLGFFLIISFFFSVCLLLFFSISSSIAPLSLLFLRTLCFLFHRLSFIYSVATVASYRVAHDHASNTFLKQETRP